MSRSDNINIARETREISNNGFYKVNGHMVNLEYGLDHGCDRVIVITPEYVEDMQDDVEQFVEDEIEQHFRQCEFKVVNMDSYAAEFKYCSHDRALVMNFANARHPGGGFLNGATAQEESLCRCSSLYESLISDEAAEMYQYNSQTDDPCDSDYMLISPFVDVFRNTDGKLLDECHSTAVLTIAAPNLNGRAGNVEKTQLAYVMTYKLQSMLLTAAAYKYDTLVLGAWGCGAFGHDAVDVAGYFEDILVKQGYFKFFKQIVFAIYDRSADQYNYKSFVKTFGEYGTWEE